MGIKNVCISTFLLITLILEDGVQQRELIAYSQLGAVENKQATFSYAFINC